MSLPMHRREFLLKTAAASTLLSTQVGPHPVVAAPIAAPKRTFKLKYHFGMFTISAGKPLDRSLHG